MGGPEYPGKRCTGGKFCGAGNIKKSSLRGKVKLLKAEIVYLT
jgi:hypothetical protein